MDNFTCTGCGKADEFVLRFDAKLPPPALNVGYAKMHIHCWWKHLRWVIARQKRWASRR